MTRASDMPVSAACIWMTAANPSSTLVLNSLRKMVAGRAITPTCEKKKPTANGRQKPRGLSRYARQGRSFEQPSKHGDQDQHDDGGYLEHAGLVVSGTHQRPPSARSCCSNSEPSTKTTSTTIAMAPQTTTPASSSAVMRLPLRAADESPPAGQP